MFLVIKTYFKFPLSELKYMSHRTLHSLSICFLISVCLFFSTINSKKAGSLLSFYLSKASGPKYSKYIINTHLLIKIFYNIGKVMEDISNRLLRETWIFTFALDFGGENQGNSYPLLQHNV